MRQKFHNISYFLNWGILIVFISFIQILFPPFSAIFSYWGFFISRHFSWFHFSAIFFFSRLLVREKSVFFRTLPKPWTGKYQNIDKIYISKWKKTLFLKLFGLEYELLTISHHRFLKKIIGWQLAHNIGRLDSEKNMYNVIAVIIKTSISYWKKKYFYKNVKPY